MYISLWENYRGHPDNISFMQFSTKIDGFEQKESQGFENSYNSYEQYPLEKFFIFTIYQNYTLALNNTLDSWVSGVSGLSNNTNCSLWGDRVKKLGTLGMLINSNFCWKLGYENQPWGLDYTAFQPQVRDPYLSSWRPKGDPESAQQFAADQYTSVKPIT